MTAKTNLTINPQRLWDALMETAKFGGTPKGGIKRLTVSDEDKKVRDWFKAECEKLGCAVVVDEVGNMFATRPGRRKDLAPIAMGSHLDTQPTGGKFDGVLGVLGALEAMRTLVDMGYETNAPVMIVNWTNEEGSRFAPAMLCSGVYAGVFTADFAYGREDRNGIKLGDELERIGYKGTIKAGDVRFQAMFELHIEQGPILEAEEQDDRRGHRRAGHALVRGDAARPGVPHRRHAHGPAQECAAGRGAHDRGHPPGGHGASSRRRLRRPHREPAQQPQRGAGRGLLHRRPPPSGRKGAGQDGGRVQGRAAEDRRRARSSSWRRSASGIRRR